MICRLFFLGVDPGLKGGFALLSDAEPGKILILDDFDKVRFLDMLSFLSHEQQVTRCCLEKVGARPGQGVTSMFHFGENYGWLKGAMDMAEISFQEIQPQRWKREFSLGSDKKQSVEVARQLYPQAELIPKGCRVPKDGRAEALLMATFAWRKL